MKKIFLLIAVFYSVTGWGQAGNLIHSYIPTWSTGARPTLTNGDIGINTDSSKLQFNIGGTTFTVGGSGGGTTYTASQSVTLTGANFTLTNDNASPGNSMLYGTNSGGTLGWYAQPGGLSGLTTGYMPVATGSAALGSSNVFTTGKEATITFGTSNTYADYIGYGAGNANNRFNAAINIFNDSIGFSNFGGTISQVNSAVMQVNGVADILGNLYVASSGSTSGMEITASQIWPKLSTNPLYILTGTNPTYAGVFYPSGNSSFNASSDNGISILQPTSTTLPQVGGFYNSSNYFEMQANSSGNLTVTASGGNITLAGVQNFSGYGSGTNTGTLAYALGTTSAGKVIEVPVSSGSAIASTYVPTLTNTTNITTSTLESATFTRIANTVHANIGVLLTATTSATTTVLTFTLPVTTSNGSQLYVGSAAIETNVSGTPAYTSGIISIVSTTTGTLTFLNTTSVGSGPVNIIFDYSL